MEIKLQNEDFTMFKENAKIALEKHVADYAQQLKDEAERVAIPQFQDKEDAIVYESTVNSVIGLRGHHVFKKNNVFYTYILPCVDAILGSIFASMLCIDEKKVVAWCNNRTIYHIDNWFNHFKTFPRLK